MSFLKSIINCDKIYDWLFARLILNCFSMQRFAKNVYIVLFNRDLSAFSLLRKFFSKFGSKFSYYSKSSGSSYLTSILIQSRIYLNVPKNSFESSLASICLSFPLPQHKFEMNYINEDIRYLFLQISIDLITIRKRSLIFFLSDRLDLTISFMDAVSKI